MAFSLEIPDVEEVKEKVEQELKVTEEREATVDEAAKQKVEVTDDAQAVELIGETVKIYEWRNANIKITTAEDLQLAAAVLKI